VLFDGSTGAVRTVVASHPEAEQLTRLIQQLGLGLNATAIQAGQTAAVEDLTGSARAGLAEAAQRVGMPVTAGLALRGGEEVVGCLQLFGRALDTVTDGLLDELAPLAAVLGAVLGNLEAYHHSASLVASLTSALDRQRPIEQAKGMLAERHGVDLDAAYRMLRAQAHRRGITVVAAAAELVSESWRSSADPPAPAAEPAGRTAAEQTARSAAAEQTPSPEAEPAAGPASLPPGASAPPPPADSDDPPGQTALLDVGAVPVRPTAPSRAQPRRPPNTEPAARAEQPALLDLAAVPEQASKPDRNGTELHPEQTPLPEQRGGPTQVETRPTA
jgi:ANTAR domain